MKVTAKKIKIEVNFNDINELKFRLDAILSKVRTSHKIGKTDNYNFELQNVVEPRIETINGIMYEVYPSKMNFK